MIEHDPRHARKQSILVVLHQEQSTTGRIGRLLEHRGHRLDIRRPRFGDPLPKTMHDHAAAIIFGGPMSANDPDEFVKREVDWIGTPLREGKPFLGVCLGAQMLARHLGERVYCDPQGRAEIGYYPVQATEAGHACCASPFPEKVYQWHREGFDLPRDATLLAKGREFETQAMKYGDSAYALQFHPEVTFAMICRWTTKGHDRMDAPGAQPGHSHRDDWFRFDGAIHCWIDAFLDQWLASGRKRPGQLRAA
jgi:GMP synthase (glutamine-hydrolysing)